MATILIFCNDLDYFRRHRLVVAQRLAQDATVVVTVGGATPDGFSSDGLRYLHVPIDRFSVRPLLDFKLALKSLRLMWCHRPTSVHLITLKPAVYCGIASMVARWLGFGPDRVVVTIPGLGRLMSPGMARKKGAFATASRFFVRFAIASLAKQKNSYFTFETAHDRDHWVQQGLVRIDNSFVIRGAGVNPADYFPAKQAKPNRPLKVLFASRLIKSKGLEAFLFAAQLARKHADFEFIVAGIEDIHDPDGYAVDDLENIPDITFKGESKDMPRLLRESDVVCLPTLYGEGIPRILIEAAASGLPSVGTTNPGCAEIIESGKTGMLFPVGSMEEMAASILLCLKKYLDEPPLWHTHATAARQRFLEGGFVEDEIVQQFVDLIVGPSGPSAVQVGSVTESG